MTTQHAAETIKYSHAVEGLPCAQVEEHGTPFPLMSGAAYWSSLNLGLWIPGQNILCINSLLLLVWRWEIGPQAMVMEEPSGNYRNLPGFPLQYCDTADSIREQSTIVILVHSKLHQSCLHWFGITALDIYIKFKIHRSWLCSCCSAKDFCCY